MCWRRGWGEIRYSVSKPYCIRHITTSWVIDPDKKDDNIYNAAVDNTTECGVLLKLARAWSQVMPPAPPRAILFAAVTAAEQGLLGSEYLGKHSPVPAGENLVGLEL